MCRLERQLPGGLGATIRSRSAASISSSLRWRRSRAAAGQGDRHATGETGRRGERPGAGAPVTATSLPRSRRHLDRQHSGRRPSRLAIPLEALEELARETGGLFRGPVSGASSAGVGRRWHDPRSPPAIRQPPTWPVTTWKDDAARSLGFSYLSIGGGRAPSEDMLRASVGEASMLARRTECAW